MKRTLLVAAVLAMLLMACGAQAAQVSYTSTVGPARIDWPLFGQQALNIQQFDTAMGTLNSVKIDFGGTMDIVVNVIDGNTFGIIKTFVMPTTASVNTDVLTMTLSDGFGAVASVTLNNVYSDLVTGPTSTGWSYAQVTMGDIAPFIGTGTLSMPVLTNSIGTSQAEGGQNAFVGFTGMGTATATVTYDFTAVPEPSSIIMLLGGMGSLLALRRRRA